MVFKLCCDLTIVTHVYLITSMVLDGSNHNLELLSTQTDAALIQACQAGNQGAIAVLYDRYSGLVYRLAFRMLGNAQEAEDLTQEIFVNLWRGTTYQADRGSLSSFLITLTRSRAIDRLRSRSSNFRFLQRWSQTLITKPAPATPFELASLEQRSEHVREALQQLPDKHRQVLELAYYEGLSQSEIAAQLGIPLGTVKTWSRQGLLTLKTHLKALIE